MPSTTSKRADDSSIEQALRVGRALGLSGALQLGYVVDDIDGARRRIGSRLGVQAWYRPRVIKQKLVFQTRPIEHDLSIVVGYGGGVQVELIERDDRRSSLFEIATADPEVNPHHFGYFVPSVESQLTRLADLGLRSVQHGSIWFARGHRTRVAYVDARPTLGAIVELIEHRMQGVNIGMPSWYVKLGAGVGLVERLDDR